MLDIEEIVIVSLSLFLYLYLSQFLFQSMSLFVSLSMPLFVSLSLSLPLSLFLYLSLSLSLFLLASLVKSSPMTVAKSLIWLALTPSQVSDFTTVIGVYFRHWWRLCYCIYRCFYFYVYLLSHSSPLTATMFFSLLYLWYLPFHLNIHTCNRVLEYLNDIYDIYHFIQVFKHSVTCKFVAGSWFYTHIITKKCKNYYI